MTLKPAVMDAVARVESRVFIGPEGSRNEQWLAISKRYTVDSFAAAAGRSKGPGEGGGCDWVDGRGGEGEAV